jgi:hypothetical protein
VKTTAVAQEVHGVDNGGSERPEKGDVESSGDLESFWDEKWNDTGRVNIFRFKNISSGSGLKLLLIVLESGPKRFWFQTATDEGIIISSLKLEPLLIS